MSADGEVTALALDGRGEDLFVGTSRGELLRYDLRDRSSPRAGGDGRRRGGAEVTALGFLIGDRTLVVGDAQGRVSTWQVVPAGRRRRAAVSSASTSSPPTARRSAAFAASARDKGFVTADARGGLHVELRHLGPDTAPARASRRLALRAVAFAPKADGWLTVAADGRLAHWRLDNPHPEVTLAHAVRARSGTRGIPSPSTSGSRPAAPTTSRPSSA